MVFGELFDVDIVKKRKLAWAAGIAVGALAFNIASPIVIAHQRTMPTGTYAMTFDGPDGEHFTRTTTLEKSTATDPTTGKDKNIYTLSTEQTGPNAFTDSFQINPTTAFPEEDRQGLGAYLPYRPERRSYPYYDPGAQATVPLDYLGPGSVGGLDTYQYRATLPDGTQRTVNAERRTGTLIDETWSLPSGVWALDDASKSAAVDRARSETTWLRALQIMALLTRFVAAIAIVWALVLLARRR